MSESHMNVRFTCVLIIMSSKKHTNTGDSLCSPRRQKNQTMYYQAYTPSHMDNL